MDTSLGRLGNGELTKIEYIRNIYLSSTIQSMFVKIISYLYNYSSKTTYTDRGTKMADENELKGAPTGGPDRTHAAQAVRALRRGTNPEGAQDKTGPQQL